MALLLQLGVQPCALVGRATTRVVDFHTFARSRVIFIERRRLNVSEPVFSGLLGLGFTVVQLRGEAA